MMLVEDYGHLVDERHHLSATSFERGVRPGKARFAVTAKLARDFLKQPKNGLGQLDN
jgi:hypothetical protein